MQHHRAAPLSGMHVSLAMVARGRSQMTGHSIRPHANAHSRPETPGHASAWIGMPPSRELSCPPVWRPVRSPSTQSTALQSPQQDTLSTYCISLSLHLEPGQFPGFSAAPDSPVSGPVVVPDPLPCVSSMPWRWYTALQDGRMCPFVHQWMQHSPWSGQQTNAERTLMQQSSC